VSATGRELPVAQANLSVSSRGKIRGVHLSVATPGLGHAFRALSKSATDVYLRATVYDPPTEKAVTPLDPARSIDWSDVEAAILSDKDRDAPTLAEAEARADLPR
jgi:dTDP-4-dehydrorhamnose 3,5-epimerase